MNLGSLVSRGGAPKPTGSQKVPVVLAGGEYAIHPDDVRKIGHGNLKNGHKILDHFVVEVRKKTTKELQKLPGPKK
jgi:hypothetical protein